MTTNPAGRLPQFITDGGIETHIIFNMGVELPHFSAFPLNDSAAGREVIRSYYRDYLPVARAAGRSFLFATDSWRASPDWADRLGYDRALLKQNNATSAALCAELADEFAAAGVASAIAGIIGPRRDAWQYDAGIYDLVSAQDHFSMHGRDFVLTGTLAEMAARNPRSRRPCTPHGRPRKEPPKTLYKQPWPSDHVQNGTATEIERSRRAAPDRQSRRWSGARRATMASRSRQSGDGDRPQRLHRLQRVCARLPGGEQHRRRWARTRWRCTGEMHWNSIRIDAYYRVNGHDGPDVPETDFANLQGNLETVFQPVPCMQCENAPCWSPFARCGSSTRCSRSRCSR